MDKHLESCNGGVVTHRWCGGVYEPPKTIKQSLASYGFDVQKHDFPYPHIIVYDTETSLPDADVQPAAKRAKLCADVNGVC